ncbi:MAG: DMT family transporter [Rhodothermales bacterium]
MPSNKSVYLILLVGLSVVSFSPILVRFASEGEALAIAALRTTFAALLLLPWIRRGTWHQLKALSRREYVAIAIAGVALSLHLVAWIESLYHTTVASASVLFALTPVFLAIIGYLFLQERLGRNHLIAIAVAVGGAMLIGYGDHQQTPADLRPLLGNTLAVSAAVLMSIYIVFGRSARQRVSWLPYVFPLYTVTAVVTLCIAVVREVPLMGYSPTFYALCFVMALGPSIVGHGAINYALGYVSAAIVGLLTLLEPLVASAAAYVLFDEQPSALALIGMVIVLGAVVFVLREGQK